MQLYSIILDIGCVIISLLVVMPSYRKGFLRSIILCIGYIASIIVAINVSRYLSKFIFDTIIRESIIKNVNTTITGNIDSAGIQTVVGGFMSKLPSFLKDSISAYFGGEQGIIDNLQKTTGGVVNSIGTTVADNIVAPIVVMLLQTLICVIVFVICIIIVKMIARLFQGFYAIPVIGPINSMLGGVVGIAQAAVLLYILAVLGKMLISLSSNSLEYFNTNIIQSTYVFKIFYNLKFI